MGAAFMAICVSTLFTSSIANRATVVAKDKHRPRPEESTTAMARNATRIAIDG